MISDDGDDESLISDGDDDSLNIQLIINEEENFCLSFILIEYLNEFFYCDNKNIRHLTVTEN
jgi:hypothetical protein